MDVYSMVQRTVIPTASADAPSLLSGAWSSHPLVITVEET